MDAKPVGPLSYLMTAPFSVTALDDIIREYESFATDVLRFPEALTPEELYSSELQMVLAEEELHEDEAVLLLLALLAALRSQLIELIADLGDETFLAVQLPRLRADINQLVTTYATRTTRALEEASERFSELGIEAIDRPLTAARVTLMAQAPAPAPVYAEVLQAFRAELITALSDDISRRVMMELQLGAVGEKTPAQIQQIVGDVLRTKPTATKKIGTFAARLEEETRTEINRSFNLATQSRQEALQTRVQQVLPDVQPTKRWLNAGDNRVRPAHRRASLLTQRPTMDEDFILTDDKGQKWRAKGPHDPRLPAGLVINCRCRSVLSLDSIASLLEVS